MIMLPGWISEIRIWICCQSLSWIKKKIRKKSHSHLYTFKSILVFFIKKVLIVLYVLFYMILLVYLTWPIEKDDKLLLNFPGAFHDFRKNGKNLRTSLMGFERPKVICFGNPNGDIHEWAVHAFLFFLNIYWKFSISGSTKDLSSFSLSPTTKNWRGIRHLPLQPRWRIPVFHPRIICWWC